MADGQEDLFGDNDDTDHFFLPEHYDQNRRDIVTPTSGQPPVVDNYFEPFREDDDNRSLASSGLGDDDLPEEEEATNRFEDDDLDVEQLVARAKRDANEAGEDTGQEVHLPDLGNGVAGAGSMAAWVASVRNAPLTDQEPATEDYNDLRSREEILREYYPSFRPNEILNFSELFYTRQSHFRVVSKKQPRICVPSRLVFEVELDAAHEFNSLKRKRTTTRGIVHSEKQRQIDLLENEEVRSEVDADDADLIMACAQWDIDATISDPVSRLHFTKEPQWSTNDLYDGAYEVNKVILDCNDSQLLLTEQLPRRSIKRQRKGIARRYNISNDEAYAMLQDTHRSKLRSTLTQLTIEHAGFAERLQSPYYKTLLTKTEARAFHRPAMPFKPNQEIRFSRLRPRKKKKDRSRDPRLMLAMTKDITLTDNTGFVCFEYSEEYPHALSNTGMGSKVLNYYRKRTEEDEYRPKEEYGDAHVLGPTERSPFWNFGTVQPGETTPTLYNRLFRAPIFKHKTQDTDFLFIKSATKHGVRYFLRNMKHLFTVGQTLPVLDVPGPHSRKVTTSYKNRLKMIAFRLVRRSPQGRLQIKELMRHFPDQNEMQIRQRLKDFMEYQRKGEDQGYWRLKAGDLLPSEEATRTMIDPETACLVESMQVGLRHLEDSGYGKSAEADDDMDENMTVEQQLAPWIATRNFLNATQGKAMLQLYGEGDPTSRGEGFSFIRTSMKGGFRPAGESVNDVLENDKPLQKGAHAYNVAKQQRAYEEEIGRIWHAQKVSLRMEQPMLDEEVLQTTEFDGASPFTPSEVAPSPSAESDDDDMSLNSGTSAANQGKVLRIERLVRDEHGNATTETEVVTDPHVIHAYILKRQTMDESELANDALGPSNDDEKNRRVKNKIEAELARLKRNAERRRLRKIAKANGTLKTKSRKSQPPLE